MELSSQATPAFRNRHAICVFRAIFRARYNRFRDCVANGAHASTVSLEFFRDKEAEDLIREKEEYMADFYLVSRRELDALGFRVFRYHFLLGADWKLCCRQLGMDRGNFLSCRIPERAKARARFRRTGPYGLYPVDEYFGGPSAASQYARFRPLPCVL